MDSNSIIHDHGHNEHCELSGCDHDHKHSHDNTAILEHDVQHDHGHKHEVFFVMKSFDSIINFK